MASTDDPGGGLGDPGGGPGGGVTSWSTVVKHNRRQGKKPPTPKSSDPASIHVRVTVGWQGTNPNNMDRKNTITKLNMIYSALLAQHEQTSVTNYITIHRIMHPATRQTKAQQVVA